MAKGDGFELALEAVFELTADIFRPRPGSVSMISELSFSWLGVLILVCLALGSVKSMGADLASQLDEEQFGQYKQRLRVGRWALWGVVFLSLFMFRFASAF